MIVRVEESAARGACTVAPGLQRALEVAGERITEREQARGRPREYTVNRLQHAYELRHGARICGALAILEHRAPAHEVAHAEQPRPGRPAHHEPERDAEPA